MELEVGMYVRTDDGHIDKLLRLDSHLGELQSWSLEKLNTCYPNESFIKASHNIIELLEDKDLCKIEFYSNRYKERVTRLFEIEKLGEYINFKNRRCELVMKSGEWFDSDKELNPIIKEICTKEQFESVSYKLGKED